MKIVVHLLRGKTDVRAVNKGKAIAKPDQRYDPPKCLGECSRAD
jgi:hypothetical protein